MTTLTIEDIRRLVPRGLVGYCAEVLENSGHAGDQYHSVLMLLTTRAQLEVAVDALEMVKDCSLNPAHTMTQLGLEDCIDACSKVSREALAKIKDMQQCEKH